MAEEKILKGAAAGKFKGLPWPELIRGTLLKRYKRFLADVELEDGTVVTAHCSNSGTMKTCSTPGSPVYLSYHDDPKRKLKYSWQIIEMPTSLVGVNTLVPNRLVFASIREGMVPELTGYDLIRSEVNTGNGSRIDIRLTGKERETCFVEIKNCTMIHGGKASFPDAVTTRGQKHLVELRELCAGGDRAVIFFLVQRMDAELFSPADRIDPDYGEELRRAADSGVEVLVYDVKIDMEKIRLNRKIPYKLREVSGAVT